MAELYDERFSGKANAACRELAVKPLPGFQEISWYCLRARKPL